MMVDDTRQQLIKHAAQNRAELAAGKRRTRWTGGSLEGANLRGAHLSGADLSGADLRGADLRDANLRGAHLSGADLSGADLRGAHLSGADLWGAHLSGADLRDADLWIANLSGADLRDANLRGADLSGADLRGADLRGASGLPRLHPDPRALRLVVADHIEQHPELHEQRKWGSGRADPNCGTPCCVAGRACHLGGGTHGYSVPTAATLLLHVDGLPMPSFAASATREEILAALRAT